MTSSYSAARRASQLNMCNVDLSSNRPKTSVHAMSCRTLAISMAFISDSDAGGSVTVQRSYGNDTPPSSILLSRAELAHLASSGIEVGVEL